ncbi:hypothetical protein V6L77_17245 [Pannonibacter sp. Pt2-lr]
MSAARFALLPDRGLVRVSGPEATHFLQNLLTRDVEGLTTGEAAFAALLTPQGKILFDFLVLKDLDGFLLDTPASQVAALVKRLGFYRLRAKVTLEDCSSTHEVAVIFGDALPAAPLAPDVLAVTDPALLNWACVWPGRRGWRTFWKALPCRRQSAQTGTPTASALACRRRKATSLTARFSP